MLASPYRAQPGASAKQPIFDPQGFLYMALSKAHDEVVALGRDLDVDFRPRATCALCLVQEGFAFWAHVGDSRIYLLRDGVRYPHILNPRTAWPVMHAPRSVTVLGAKPFMELTARPAARLPELSGLLETLIRVPCPPVEGGVGGGVGVSIMRWKPSGEPIESVDSITRSETIIYQTHIILFKGHLF